VQNPNAWDRLLWKLRRAVIGWLQGRPAATSEPVLQPAE
jgi:hypothetical protein